VLFQQPGGALQLYFKVGPSPTTWWGELTESRDNGVTWSEPRRLPEDILGPVKNKPILLKSGALLCGSSTEHDGWQVQFEITSDAGKTWKLVGPINDASVFNVIQPTLLVHPAGAIQALCRSKESIIVETWSTDSGKTWSKLQPTSLPNPNSGIDGVTLKDGRQLLVYNHTTREKGKWGGPRSKLNVAVSKDGKNWLAAVELENEPGEFSYPAVIQSADGLVHITYTWKRKRVKRVVLDPKQLKLKEMVEGNWPK
jgi:predicted neuraminidase